MAELTEIGQVTQKFENFCKVTSHAGPPPGFESKAITSAGDNTSNDDVFEEVSSEKRFEYQPNHPISTPIQQRSYSVPDTTYTTFYQNHYLPPTIQFMPQFTIGSPGFTQPQVDPRIIQDPRIVTLKPEYNHRYDLMTTRSPSNHIDMPPEFDATKYFILAGTETAYQAEEQFDLKQHQRMTSGDYINQFKEVTPKSKKLPKFLKYSPNREKYGQRPNSQGSSRGSYPRSPRYHYSAYSDLNLYIAGFKIDFELENLQTTIISVVKKLWDAEKLGEFMISEKVFSVQVKESNKDLECGDIRPKIDQTPPESPKFVQKIENTHYAFLDFEDKELATKMLHVLESDENQIHLREIFGNNFNCRRAKKQNQDMTNVFFKGQPESFRNKEEYKNADTKTKLNHSYNEQEIVLTAIHIYLLNIEDLDSPDLKRVVSLRIQSEQKTKRSDPNPGLICLIRYKYEEDAKKIIKIFGGTEDKTVESKPKKFLDAMPFVTENSSNNQSLSTLSDLDPEILIKIIRKMKSNGWPNFGETIETSQGKKISTVGAEAFERAIEFCENEEWKFQENGGDLVEVKYANTQQERSKKTPENSPRYDGSCYGSAQGSGYGSESRSVSGSAYGSGNSVFSPVNKSGGFRPRVKIHSSGYRKPFSEVNYTERTPGRSSAKSWRNQMVKPSPSQTINSTPKHQMSNVPNQNTLKQSKPFSDRYRSKVNLDNWRKMDEKRRGSSSSKSTI